ncbi:MAG: Fic family protein [Tannerella sp.]|jgi:Fic family protein|nr:Fic family protein [Tannerella sp.]
MKTSKPPFTITPKTLDLVAAISEKIGQMASVEHNIDLRLRKANRLKSIQSSLAIENNSLTLGQVTDIIEGKKVLGNPREIQEVKNAHLVYEKLLSFNPFSVKDFLNAHKILTAGLVKQSGIFRTGDVGVFDGKGNAVHIGARQQFVHSLISDLFAWGKADTIHPLVKSSVFHFEIETIHPFQDGNGRMGRLWQTLILSQHNELFQWLPVETLVYKNQSAYYNALEQSRKQNSEATLFVEFMLMRILETLQEYAVHNFTDKITDKITDKLSATDKAFINQIGNYLLTNGYIDNYNAGLLSGKKTETVKKQFAKLVETGLLVAQGERKTRKYFLATKSLKTEPLTNL